MTISNVSTQILYLYLCLYQVATLQVAASDDAFNLNVKPSTLPSPILSTHHHYFHTSLIPQKTPTHAPM